MKIRLSIPGLFCSSFVSDRRSGRLLQPTSPEEDCPDDRRPRVVQRPSPGRGLRRHAEPWEVDHEKGWMVVGGDADDPPAPARPRDSKSRSTRLGPPKSAPREKNHPVRPEGIPGFQCYRTVEETFQAAEDLVANNPDMASWIDVGDSWEKDHARWRPRFRHEGACGSPTPTWPAPPRPAFTGKPRLFVTSAIHAREYTTAELMTRFAEYLVANHGIDADATWLLDEHEIHLLLITNPDGRKHAETGILWRKNTNEDYCSPTSNDRGADLNRNFEFQWDCCGGSSGYVCDETYRGPSMASEPEVQTIQSYVRSIFPDQRDHDLGAAAPADATGIYIDIHSHSELVLWPWGFTNTANRQRDARSRPWDASSRSSTPTTRTRPSASIPSTARPSTSPTATSASRRFSSNSAPGSSRIAPPSRRRFCPTISAR